MSYPLSDREKELMLAHDKQYQESLENGRNGEYYSTTGGQGWFESTEKYQARQLAYKRGQTERVMSGKPKHKGG